MKNGANAHFIGRGRALRERNTQQHTPYEVLHYAGWQAWSRCGAAQIRSGATGGPAAQRDRMAHTQERTTPDRPLVSLHHLLPNILPPSTAKITLSQMEELSTI